MDENFYSERRHYRTYSKSLKKSLVREYLDSNCSKAYLKRKYGVSGITLVSEWIRVYGNNFDLSVEKEAKEIPIMKPEDTPEVQKLKQRIRQLEKELEDAKILSEAYSLMIKKAEEELKVPIRKKLNTK